MLREHLCCTHSKFESVHLVYTLVQLFMEVELTQEMISSNGSHYYQLLHCQVNVSRSIMNGHTGFLREHIFESERSHKI
jgi:hypothetical protein